MNLFLERAHLREGARSNAGSFIHNTQFLLVNTLGYAGPVETENRSHENCARPVECRQPPEAGAGSGIVGGCCARSSRCRLLPGGRRSVGSGNSCCDDGLSLAKLHRTECHRLRRCPTQGGGRFESDRPPDVAGRAGGQPCEERRRHCTPGRPRRQSRARTGGGQRAGGARQPRAGTGRTEGR